MQVVPKDSLIPYRIVAISRGEALTGSGGWGIFLTVIAKELPNIENVLLVEDLRDSATGFIVVIDFQNRA